MLPGAERHFRHDDDFGLALGGGLVERRADAQAPLDVGSGEILLPKGVPILRLDGDVAPGNAVTGKQSVDLGLAIGQPLLRDVSLQDVGTALETLERELGQLGDENLGLRPVGDGNIQCDEIHRKYIRFSISSGTD